MGRRLFRHLIVLFAVGSANSALSAQVRAPQVLEVCASCAYTSIGSALKAAKSGAIVRIGGGVYREGGLLISRSVTLEPRDPASTPVLDGEGKYEILKITAPGVTVRGLHLRDSGYQSTRDIASIRVERTKGCLLADNEIENGAFGIYLAKVTHCTILRNHIHSADRESSNSGSGIHIWSGDAIEIVGNDLSGHRDGIYFEFVGNSRIVDNKSHDNFRYGIHFMFSHGDTYQRNQFSRNESGVAVMYSRHITMTANRFEHSHGAASYGILLKDITDSVVQGNLFSDDTTGMYAEDVSRVRILENDFEQNGWALRLNGSSDGNWIERNNFISNTFEVAALPGGARNAFDSNYWSQYEGLDLNHRGVGDIPYHPVRLSAIWMQSVDGASFLLGSLFMAMADRAEALLPAITPETVVDAHPLMKRRP